MPASSCQPGLHTQVQGEGGGGGRQGRGDTLLWRVGDYFCFAQPLPWLSPHYSLLQAGWAQNVLAPPIL